MHLQFTDSLLSCAQSADESGKGVSHFNLWHLWFRISLDSPVSLDSEKQSGSLMDTRKKILIFILFSFFLALCTSVLKMYIKLKSVLDSYYIKINIQLIKIKIYVKLCH
jgi:hypothetical protein